MFVKKEIHGEFLYFWGRQLLSKQKAMRLSLPIIWLIIISLGLINNSQGQNAGFNDQIDSIDNKDVLIIRGVFIRDRKNIDGYKDLERVPQVRLIEEFIRAHRQNETKIIWIHTQRPEYSDNPSKSRIQKLLHYLKSKEVPIFGLDFMVITSAENELFRKYGSPDIPTIILISDPLKW